MVYLGRVQAVMKMDDYAEHYPTRKDALYKNGRRIEDKETCSHSSARDHETDLSGEYALIFDKESFIYCKKDYLPLPLDDCWLAKCRSHKRIETDDEAHPVLTFIKQSKANLMG